METELTFGQAAPVVGITVLMVWLISCILPEKWAKGNLYARGTGVIPSVILLYLVALKIIAPNVVEFAPVMIGFLLCIALFWVFVKCVTAAKEALNNQTVKTIR